MEILNNRTNTRSHGMVQILLSRYFLFRLRFDTCRVEMVLIQPHHVTKLIGVFRSPKNKKEFTKILQALHQMIKDSEKLADALGTSGNSEI